MMADDPDRDLIPTKEETKGPYVPISTAYAESSEIHGLDRPTLLEKRVAEQLSRSDLEDQLYKLRDENLELKKTSRKQEEQLKKLATKMSRLLNERKKKDGHFSPGHKRDVEMEEAMEELHDKVRNLERSNAQLREKLLVAKQQVIKQTQRPNAYNYVPSKVNSGRPRSGVSPYVISANLRGANVQNQRGNPSALPPYVIQLLDEARNELFNLKELVATQRSEIDMYEQEVELLRERLRMKDAEFDEELNILKSQITEGQRHHVQENLDLIRLHRELKQKNSKIISLQSQLSDMDEKLRNQHSTNDRLMKEVEEKTSQVQEEQKKSVELVTELQKSKVALHSLSELQESYKALKKENDVLKDTNDKLIKSVLNQERDKSSQSAEQLLKERISQLEAFLNAEVKEKTSLQEKIREEKEKYQKLSEEHLNLQNTFSEIKQQTEELHTKVNILKEEDVDFEELGEALALIKLKKQRSLKINFLENTPIQEEEEEDLKSKLLKAEKEHSETIKELCSVREMLMTQYKINKDAQDELKSATESFSQKEKEYQTKLEEYANLLDIRAAKILKLERQLNDVAYGTKKFKIEEYHEPQAETMETLELTKGENLFEIHIVKFVYSEEGLKFLKNTNPSSFLTWNFYEFELQSTQVVKGPNPHFGCSARYRVKVDDFFLYYLHKNTATLELHESLGTDYKTLAAGQLKFSDILEQSQGRLHLTQHLISVQESSNVVLGTVYFWMKLHVPMEEAFKLYKQKFKALKYIQSNQITSATAAKMLDQPPKKNSSANDLHIKIVRCSNLKIHNDKIQPSAFCMYKFYNLPDHDTAIIPSSNSPEFSDHHTFTICSDSDFEKYLRTQNLEIFVFDNDDLDISAYIGKASIPLVPLSKGKSIKGIFELTKDGMDESFGSIEISIYWQNGYESSSSISLPSQLEMPIEFPPHIAPVTPVLLENELSQVSDHEVSSGAPPKPPRSAKQSRPSSSKPLRTSTPIKRTPASSTTTSSIEELARMNLAATDGETPPSPVNPNRTQPINSSTRHSSASEKSGNSQASRKSALKNEGLSLEQKRPDSSSSKSHQEQKRPDSSSSKSHQSAHSSKDATFTKAKDDLLFDEISDEDKQALPDSDTSSESDHVLRVVPCSPAKQNESHTMPNIVIGKMPTIVIGINELSLQTGSSVLNDSSIQMLYVEFKFLDYPLEELETPYSLPKPIPPESIKFDCKKVFMFHPEKNIEKYKLLAQMFTPEMPEASWIKFTVVSEPPTDEEGLECEDVGYAYVDLREILRRGKDMIDEVLSIYDAKATETEIGKLTVTVEALGVLQLL